MKKFLSILLLCSPLWAADTYTPRTGLIKPEESSTDWGPKIRQNYDIIDSSFAALGSSNTFTANVTFSSGVTISSPSFSRVYVNTSTYSGSEVLAVNGNSKFFGSLGANVAFCDANGINCQNATIATSNPSTGLNVTTMTVTHITISTFSASSGTVSGSITVGTMTISQNGNMYLEDTSTRLSISSKTAQSTFFGPLSGSTKAVTLNGETGFGYNTLSGLSMTGTFNSALGANTLSSVTSGSANTAVGASALTNLTSAGSTTAVGRSALTAVTTGGNNTAIGAFSLTSNTSGANNTAVGTVALEFNTTGSNNTAVGFNALLNNVDAANNTAIGTDAGRNLTTGDSNTTIGEFSLFTATSAAQNVAIGPSALYGVTRGDDNIGIGYFAGYGLDTSSGVTTGSKNVFLGYNTSPSTSAQLTNAIAIGANATVGSSNTMQLGGSGVNAVTVNMTSATVSGYFQFDSRTLAQLAVSTPTTVFQVHGCSNCTADSICIGTQTVTATWARVTSKTTACQ